MKEYDAIIFPSELESLGLPLIEAALLGVPIIGNRSVVSNIINEQTYYPFDLDLKSFSAALVKFIEDFDRGIVRSPSLMYCPYTNWRSYFDGLQRCI